MEIIGKTIVLTGKFGGLSRSAAKRELEAMGARVTGSVSAKTDLVFAGRDAGTKVAAAAARGVPVYDEDDLAAVLAGGELAAEAPGEPARGAAPFAAAGEDPESFLAALRAADWAAFVPARDLPPLRAALTGLEQAHGVTEAHRFATERLRTGGALLRHPDVHRVEMTAHALSPDGRYLAVGSWCGDHYEDGGALQIWEVATGRCVNVIDRVEGGVGWPAYGRTIQWSADASRIAVCHNTDMVGAWDPFDGRHEPLAVMPAHGNSRPSGFALHPDGTRAFHVRRTDHDIHGLVMGLLSGSRRHGLDQRGMGLTKRLSAGDRARLDAEELFFERVFWSRDGERIYGHLRDHWALSIDVAAGGVSWLLPTGDRFAAPPEWSTDERLVAVHSASGLVIADALTGRPLAEHPAYPEAAFLSWGTDRLAVVVPEDEDGRARPVVAIIDASGTHHYDLDVTLPSTRWEDTADLRPWAWAPDGTRAACLTTDGRIEIWSLGGHPEQMRTLDVPAGTRGVLWGADDVVIVAGETTLRFVRAATGETIGDLSALREPPAARPLELDGKNLWKRMRPAPDPTFALDGETWAVAFEEGTVIAPSGREDELDAVLAWTVDRRFAWPLRWGMPRTVPDVPTALEHLEAHTSGRLWAFHGRTLTAPEPPAAWPPPNTASMDDLFEAFNAAVANLSPKRWTTWLPDALQEAAVMRARRGEAAAAQALIRSLPDTRAPRAAAYAAMILAVAGQADDARALVAAHDPTPWRPSPALSAAMGGFCAAVGDHTDADRWFGHALDTVGDSTEERLHVARALTTVGREGEAHTLLTATGGPPKHSRMSAPWLSFLLRGGHTGFARELLRAGWFDEPEASEVFVGCGEPELFAEWGERHNWYVKERLPEARRNAEGRPTEPSESDLTVLTEAHAKLLKLPRAKRQAETATLIRQAAGAGHLSAALDLLPLLPQPDDGGISSLDRPWVALSTLRLAATGADVEVW
ncbi:WD40 repeat domain-containing protein [Actinomadura kijaniata]|uniref:WD40 repeat domain-containing protein n=1 Tax=Actinomadura kijaniata TaxID=46161 RepID=UPI00082C82D5|nr:WD40 repeat domain-containing protein [Actinomadura kijaniata]